jgi:hypothetical protein
MFEVTWVSAFATETEIPAATATSREATSTQTARRSHRRRSVIEGWLSTEDAAPVVSVPSIVPLRS